jgi:leader peptidase (prepilin peptidase)/N-methyltransferase
MAGIDIVFVGLLVPILLSIALIDLQQRRIPNRLNLLLALLGFVHAMIKNPGWRQVLLALATLLLAFIAFAGTSWIVRRIDRHARIGWGDLKFLIAASLWVGFDGSVAVLLVASLCSLLAALAGMLKHGMSWGQLRPFGPMLAIAMLTVVTASFIAP